MKDITLRERLNEQLLKHLCCGCFDDKKVLDDIDSVFSQFESEIANARKEGMRDYFVKTYYEESGKQPSEQEIQSAIQSLN